MKKIILIYILGISLLSAQDLKTLIDSLQTNELIKSYNYQIKSLTSQKISTNLGYLPKIDLGVNSRITKVLEPEDAFNLEPTQFAPNLSAKATWVLFDGFYKLHKSNDITAQRESMVYDKNRLQAQLSLTLTTLYFQIQNLKEDIKALNQQRDMLKAQESRLSKFYQSGIVTEDEVEKIKAVALSNQIDIDNLNYTIDKLTLNISIMTNQEILSLDKVEFKEPTNNNYLQSDEVLSLRAKIESLEAKKWQIYSSNFPKIVLMDEYIYTHFPDDYKYPSMSFGASSINLNLPQKQNKITIALSMNLTDFGSTTMSADSINQQILALKEQLIYKQRESISKFKLSTKYIKIAKNNILTAQQNVVANQKTFNAIDKKYRARVVDNIAYLDALTRLIRSKSSYEKAKNAYQLELATYYHNRGDEISQYITKETIQ